MKPGPLLTPGSAWRLVAAALIAILTFTGALATIAGGVAARSSQALSERLRDDATVAVWGSGLESADAAAARAEEALGGATDVKSVRLLDPTPSDAMVARLMGAPAVDPAEFRLIALDTPPGAKLSAGNLRAALAGAGVAGRVDDHAWGDSPILRTAALAIGVAAVTLTLVMSLAAVAISQGMRRDMMARGRTVELLRLSGATDDFITRLFFGPMVWGSFWAASLGVAAAALAVAAWTRWGAGSPLDALRPVLRADIAWALPWPLLILAIAFPGSWLTGRAVLKTAP